MLDDKEDNKSQSQNGQTDSPKEPATGKRHLIRTTWLRRLLKTLMWFIIVVLLIPVLLYIPPVQRFAVNQTCRFVEKSTGMKIGIDFFRLGFPLDVHLKDVYVVEAAGDTMVRAREAIADVKLIPLLSLDVKLKRLILHDGTYNMLSPDSSMRLSVNAGYLEVDDRSSANISKSEILLNSVRMRDGRLSLFMDVYKKKQEPDTAKSKSTPFLIKVNDLEAQNFRFAMSMLPTIDTLDVSMKKLVLKKGTVDLRENLVHWQLAEVADGNATYMTPDPEWAKRHPAPPSPPSEGPPMRIMGDSIGLSGMNVLYATRGVKPSPGFDAGYLSLKGVAVGMRNFYNESSTVRLPLTRLEAKERCGLTIVSGRGTVSVDSVGLGFQGLDIRTVYSRIKADADVPFALMALNPKAPMKAALSGRIGIPDVVSFMPSVKKFTSLVPGAKPLDFDILASGSLSDIDVRKLNLNMPGVVSLKASGKALNPLDIKKLRARIAFDGALADPALADRLISPSEIKVPAFTIKGTAEADGMEYGADFTLRSSAGDVAARGHVGLNSERYYADVDATGVDVARFAPTLGIGTVSARVNAEGAGFNPLSGKAYTDASVLISAIEYNRRLLRDISADIHLAGDGTLSLDASSANPGLDFDLEGSGRILTDDYTFDILARARDIDLMKLGMSDSICSGSGDITLRGTAQPGKWLYDVELAATRLDWNLPGQYYHLPAGVTAMLHADENTTLLKVNSDMTALDFTGSSGLKGIVDCVEPLTALLTRQIRDKNICVDSISRLLPRFDLTLNASGRGLLSQFLSPSGMSIDTVFAKISRDSLFHGDIGALNFNTGTMALDTMTLHLSERGQLLDYKAHLGNRPGTMDEFAQVNLNGYMGHNRLGAFLTQKNIQNETGYRLGLTAALMDSVMSVHFTPLRATIAYLPWKLNDDNYVDVNLINKQIQAKLQAQSAESSILVMTQPSEKDEGDDLHLKLDNIHIEDFLRMWALAPDMKGDVNADMLVHYGDARFKGSGTLGIKNFVYEKTRVGDFDIDLNAGYGFSGTTDLNAALRVNGDPAMSLYAKLSPDARGAMQPDSVGVSLTRFPLKVANAFLADNLVLGGYLNGGMEMHGSFAKPELDGHLDFDSVTAYIPVAGATLRFTDERLAVNRNIVTLEGIDIYAANNNPLTLNGTVDARDFSNMLFDLSARASNMQLIKSDKRSKADLFGKIFLNLNAGVKGPMKRLDITGNVNILGTTDATYRLNMSPAEFQTRQDDGVVKFVNFRDTTATEKTDTVVESSLNMKVNANLTISPGTQIEVLLSTNGTDKLQISPSANLNYSQNYMGDMALNGTLTLGNGYVRYAIPVMGEKMFTFDPSSTITWGGAVMNPTLNVKATDEMKANVTEGGSSRLVNFLVMLHATNTLRQLKVNFDLSTNDDMTIRNELQSMSADQRQTQAMNLLLYGQYTGQNAKANANIDGNFLYSFLESQLNSWAAKNIRGVDLTFGFNQYDKTSNGVSNTETSYSYQVSKSLFNNRFKIKVGGNYSTDAQADEDIAQNLFSDVSMEYILKQTSTTDMSVRLFRHTGFESILEGEVTEMGAGFVMKRRLENLKSLFRIRWGKRKNRDTQAQSADSAAAKATQLDDSVKPDNKGQK